MFNTPNKTRYYQTSRAVNPVEMSDLAQEIGFVKWDIIRTHCADKLVTSTHAVFCFDSKEAMFLTDDLLSLFYSNSLTTFKGII